MSLKLLAAGSIDEVVGLRDGQLFVREADGEERPADIDTDGGFDHDAYAKSAYRWGMWRILGPDGAPYPDWDEEGIPELQFAHIDGEPVFVSSGQRFDIGNPEDYEPTGNMNPNHDARGRFASKTGGGVPAASTEGGLLGKIWHAVKNLTGEDKLKVYEELKAASMHAPVPGTKDAVRVVGPAPGGSTGAQIVEDEHKTKWIMKGTGKVSKEHLANEAMADSLYRSLGVPTPQSGLSVTGNNKFSKFIEGGETLAQWRQGKSTNDIDAMHKQIAQHFAVDALLGNWDAVGSSSDNILIKDNTAYRIDNGGALRYRAQGALKTSEQWSDKVSEIHSLRNPMKNSTAAKVYGHLTDTEVAQQIRALADKKSAILMTVGTKDAELNNKLVDRLDNMNKWADSVLTPSKLSAPVPAPEPTSKPTTVLAGPYNKVLKNSLHGLGLTKGQLEKIEHLNTYSSTSKILLPKSVTPEQVKAISKLHPGKSIFKVQYKKQLHAPKAEAPASSKPLGGLLAPLNKASTGQGIVGAITTGPGPKFTALQLAKIAKLNPQGTEHGSIQVPLALNPEQIAHIKKVYPDALVYKVNASKVLKTGLAPHAPASTKMPAKNTQAGSLGNTLYTIKHSGVVISDEHKALYDKAKQTLKHGTEQEQLAAHIALHPVTTAITDAKAKAASDPAVLTKKAEKAAKKLAADQAIEAALNLHDGPGVEDHKLLKSPIATKGGAALSPHHVSAQKALTKEQKDAIFSWKGAAEHIRKQIAKGRPGEKAKAFMSALESLPPYEGQVYRGIAPKWTAASKEYMASLMAHFATAGVGGTWSDPSPKCMSRSPAKAADFAAGHLLLNIKTKTGRPIENTSGFAHEKEVVGMPGTKYKILRVVKHAKVDAYHGTIKMYVELEEI